MELKERILSAVERYPDDPAPYDDYFALCKETGDVGGIRIDLRSRLGKAIARAIQRRDPDSAERFDRLYYLTLVYGARQHFEDYLRAVEYGKPREKQFYWPRQGYLKRYVDAYQRILDGGIDFLSISMPKRCGKSQMGINFTMMLSGLHPDGSTLMEGTGDALVRSFYNGCLEYLGPPYHYHDIFPDARLVQTNADLKTVNLAEKARFPTVMCRSIDASQVGLSEATNLLYLDDCVEGYEEAKNRDRLEEKWRVISGDVIGRAIEGTPIVICGTRYSLYDPIGKLQEYARSEGLRMDVLETPALDLETDESNFEHLRNGRKVFTTRWFRAQRNLISAEQWESEFQQAPFEARGTLFPKQEMQYYKELPEGVDPDAVLAACDTAENGEDYLSLVVGYIYGGEVYVEDVVFDSSAARVTKPECANKIIKHKVQSCLFESNNAGEYYGKDVRKLVEGAGYSLCSFRSRRTISNKATRIELESDTVMKRFHFRHSSTYPPNSQYGGFMRQVWTYVRNGKVKHDDAPDSLAIFVSEMRKRGMYAKAEAFNRPF